MAAILSQLQYANRSYVSLVSGLVMWYVTSGDMLWLIYIYPNVCAGQPVHYLISIMHVLEENGRIHQYIKVSEIELDLLMCRS